MKSTVQDLFGPQVAAQIDDFWGIDSEGEIKGAFKPSGREWTPTRCRGQQPLLRSVAGPDTNGCFELQIRISGCMAEPAAKPGISPVSSPYRSGQPWMELLCTLPTNDG